jgi:O-antigen ligase
MDTSPPADHVRPLDERTPWWILGALVLLAIAAALVRIPEPLTAGAVLVVVGVAVLRHPGNGLATVVLLAPFLLGEHKTPYFLIAHVVAVGVLLGALAWWARGRLTLRPAHGVLTLGCLAAAGLALPLDLRDLLEDLWLLPSLDWALMLRQGVPDIAHLKYLERVGVLGLALGLFTVAAQPAMVPAIRGSLLPLAGLVGSVAAFGLLRFFGAIETAGQYLTLSFWTWQHPERRLTAVAWNPDYLAQWLVLALPLLLVLLWLERAPWRRRVAGVAAGLATLALVFTLQRAAYLSALVAVGSLGILLRRAGQTRPGAWARVWLAVGGVAGLAVLLDTTLLGGVVTGRVSRLLTDPNRIRLWTAALRMAADHPLLGVGTGRYAFFFHEYQPAALRAGFGPFWGTAHSLYLHVLAEQGLVGLVSVVLFFGTIWCGTFRRVRALAAERAVLACGLLGALAGWLTYGLVQFTFRVPALVYFAFVLAGTAVAVAPRTRPPRLSRGAAVTALALGLALLAWRVEAGLRRPVSPGYEAGFHRWERQPDGTAARWTRGRAAMNVPVQGRILELPLRAPTPGVHTRPQVVRIWVDRRPPLVVRLAGPDWQVVALPVASAPGGHVLVELDVDYTVVPSRVAASRDDRRLGVMVGALLWRDA